MNKKNARFLVVQVAGMGWDFLRGGHGESMDDLTFLPAETVFPAVTCTVQASFRTGTAPDSHGMPANGFFDRALRKTFFWEQSAALVKGRRIWRALRERGGSAGILFWQQSLGEDADLVISPAPVHKHHGGMIQACYSRPGVLYEHLCLAVGRKFQLRHYWGPLASGRSSQWIAAATAALIAGEYAPDLCLTYLPILDYPLQRYGPRDPRALKALKTCFAQLRLLKAAAQSNGYELLVFGDYAIVECPRGPVYPNRALRDAGLFATRTVNGRSYPDPYAGRAFGVADHEVLNVSVFRSEDIPAVKRVLENLTGVEQVLEVGDALSGRGGDLTATAAPGYWFSYKWWTSVSEAPDYAAHVDIHNKPGFDPCELFWGWPPGSVALNDKRVGGTHGRTGFGREIAWATTCPEIEGMTLLEISGKLHSILEHGLD